MLHSPPPFVWIVERCLAKDPKHDILDRDLARDLVRYGTGSRRSRRATRNHRINNLPMQPNAFIGREHEATELRRLLNRETCNS